MKKFEHDIKLLILSPEAVCGPTTFSMQLAQFEDDNVIFQVLN